jgi:hypothetical protein
MRRNIPFILLAFAQFFLCIKFTAAQNVGINSSGATPDVSAMLDIVSSDKGMLLPRVSLTSTTDATTIVSPATSLLVYNTNAGMTGDNADGVGYYYNAGTSGSPSWVKLSASGGIRWDDLRVALDRGTDATSIDFLSGSSGPQIWYFRNNGTVEAMSFNVQLPHAWKEGTTIYPHIHWLPKSSTTGNVEWNLEYTWANYDAVTTQVFPAITTSTVTSTGPFTARSHMITALTSGNTGIDGTSKKISSILVCRIWRNSNDANDTYNADAGVLFVDFHIQIDAAGSRQEYVK